MTREITRILREAQKLPPQERAELIEELLDSFKAEPRKEIDKAWADEVESRIDAYSAGHIEDIPISKVFEEIERGNLQ